ncbi:hypothetical protein [Nonomuraea sp. NPDC049504]|uniref:hypothetical protein n=1 Tax=Nonomuraea sp. NPDC049504 TaxID=3154729 RepID=UPI00341B594E
MTDRTFARLKPDKLDELAEDSYERRRGADLARAFADDRRPARRPVFLPAAGAIAAGAAVVATGVLVVTPPPAAPPAGTPPLNTPAARQVPSGDPEASPATRIDARAFLLAAADTALRERPTSGAYWYVRQRTTSPTGYWPKEFWDGVSKLQRQEQAEIDRTGAEDDELIAINEKYNKKLADLRERVYPDGPPFKAYVVESEERWRPKKAGGTHRTRRTDREVVFPTPQDEAAWRKEGSPKLLQDRPENVDDTLPRPLSIENMDITMQNVGDLPQSKKALAAQLKAQFKRLPEDGKEFDLYLWQTTVDLMTAPTTPGTRAAIFRILADQPGIRSAGEVEDAAGREGVGLEVDGDDGYEFRLVVDENTAELLEYSVAEQGEDTTKVTFEESGWTDELGERPQS